MEKEYMRIPFIELAQRKGPKTRRMFLVVLHLAGLDVSILRRKDFREAVFSFLRAVLNKLV
jgi:hypothetical protein